MVKSLGFTLAKKDDSNTHFIVLSFIREGEPTWADEGETWEDVLKQGEEVLKACVYKKR
jgi:ribosomal RNA-processing protein 8